MGLISLKIKRKENDNVIKIEKLFENLQICKKNGKKRATKDMDY